jgi:hypothetical protein
MDTSSWPTWLAALWYQGPSLAAVGAALIALRIARKDRTAGALRDLLKFELASLQIIADHTSERWSALRIDGEVVALIHYFGAERLPSAWKWAKVREKSGTPLNAASDHNDDGGTNGSGEGPDVSRFLVEREVMKEMARVAQALADAT